MSDEAAFLRAIQANPTDTTAKLVYADWLDEHGEPERAEYLRLLASEVPDEVRKHELESRVGGSWRSWLNIPMPDWNEATFYALGRLETVLDYHEWDSNWLGQPGYNFAAHLERRTATVIEEHFRAWVGSQWHPVRIESIGNWDSELTGVFRKWFFGDANGQIPEPNSPWAASREADRLRWALDSVRDVLRPLRGYRAHITHNRWYAADWDQIVLEAADRVLFLHFSGDD
jgi:uncharacterized protein (TIGR02996 family)